MRLGRKKLACDNMNYLSAAKDMLEQRNAAIVRLRVWRTRFRVIAVIAVLEYLALAWITWL